MSASVAQEYNSYSTRQAVSMTAGAPAARLHELYVPAIHGLFLWPRALLVYKIA